MLSAVHVLVYVTSVSTGLVLGDTRTRLVCSALAAVLLLQLVLRRRRAGMPGVVTFRPSRAQPHPQP